MKCLLGCLVRRCLTTWKPVKISYMSAGVGQFAGAKGMQACPTLQLVLDQSFLNTRVQSYAI